MSSTPRVVQLTALALAMLTVGQTRPLVAQSARMSAAPAEHPASNDPRIRSLERLYARRQVLEHQSKRESDSLGTAWYPDTLRVGIFRIATSPALREALVATALDVSGELAPTLDQPAIEALSRWTMHVRRPMPVERAYLRGSTLVISVSAGAANMWGEESIPFGARALVRTQLFQLVRQSTSSTFDTALREWLFNALVSPVPPEPAVEQRARLDLATAESHVARRCVSGDLAMCATLLSLAGRPADPLRTWYAREDYRPLVSRVRLAPSDGRDAPQLQRRCLANDDAACTKLLRSFDPARLPPPTADAPRQVLLHEALRVGGAGALTRLRAPRGTVGERLVAASGVSQDSLLALWHRRMVAETGASIRPTPAVALASLGWTLLLAGLGLRRVRRCR